MKLRRGFAIEKGQKVLIAEDVVTTGKSSYEAIKVVEDNGEKLQVQDVLLIEVVEI